MKINPEITPLTEPFWDGLEQGRILLQHCPADQLVWHPPEPVCPHCQTADVEWVEASGRATLYSYTWVTHPTHGAFTESVPYLVAQVELEEGPRMVSTIVGAEFGPLEIGTPLTAVFPDDDDKGLVKFVPESKGSAA